MTRPRIPLMPPTLPDFEEIGPMWRRVLESGTLTLGPMTLELEAEAARRLGVGHVVALSSCTSGLLLVVRALGIRGPIVMPSFTWASTGLAAVWNGLDPRFVDIDPATWTLSPEAAERASEGAGAILAVNIFGAYPDMDALRQIARDRGIPFISDSAQGLGATHEGRGGGSLADVEIFSMSPTKLVTAAEGGLVATDDERLAFAVRRMRDYGKTEDGKDIAYHGLSARLSEFHAALALCGLRRIDDLLASRRARYAQYVERLAGAPDIATQDIPAEESSANYFVVRVKGTGRREKLAAALAEKGIASKPYFSPPLHRQTAFAEYAPARPLPETDAASSEGLALPLWTHMPPQIVDEVADAVIENMDRDL
ncbi:DegT/DnrJ/EryC1/StrS family aminotransferase [bacterium]|nr:DegT/DnrJ/EryC1/StrS family aminotransferase [bacterium]